MPYSPPNSCRSLISPFRNVARSGITYSGGAEYLFCRSFGGQLYKSYNRHMPDLSSTLTSWFLSLDAQPQAVVVVGALAATVALLAFGASLLSAVSSFMQAGTATKKLFVDLLPTRMEWLDEFRVAVTESEAEMDFKTPAGEGGMAKSDILGKVAKCRRTAQYLFGSEVAGLALDIEQKLNVKANFVIAVRAGTNRDPRDEQARTALGITDQIDKEVGKLIVHCRPFLYVGDVKRRFVRVPKSTKDVGQLTK